jgi:hypothetical protein
MRLTEKPPAEATQLDALIEKELDAVIGKRFEERTSQSAGRRLGRSVAKWMLGAALAIAMVAVIALVLHTHLAPPQAMPAAAKPVVIEIVPARK